MFFFLVEIYIGFLYFRVVFEIDWLEVRDRVEFVFIELKRFFVVNVYLD